jgi:3,4-dihydroxy 2-butanone 4-phosphate synthase
MTTVKVSNMSNSDTSQVSAAVAALGNDECCVVADGDHGAVLFFPAQTASAARLAFAIRYSSGLVHAVVRSNRLDHLRIPDQPIFASEDCGTGFTVAVDAAGVGTGISGRDRALTLRTLAETSAAQTDLRRPGHILPIRCSDTPGPGLMGVWETAIGLVTLAGFAPVAGACRLVHDSGDVMNDAEAEEFAAVHGITIAPRLSELLTAGFLGRRVAS